MHLNAWKRLFAFSAIAALSHCLAGKRSNDRIAT